MDVDANLEKKEQDLKTGGKNMWYGYKIKSKCRELGERLLQTLKDDSGVGVVEVILILVVLIGLVIIFKTQLTNLVTTIFEKITSESSTI